MQLEQARGLCAEARIDRLLFGKVHIWEVVTWENTLRKLPLRRMPVRKYLTLYLGIIER